MADETIRIIIEGVDQASGPLGNVHGALSNISQIAAAILAARLLERVGEALASVGRVAFESVADYQKAEMAIGSLLARELLAAGGADNMADALGRTAQPAEDLLQKITRMALLSPFSEADIQSVLRIGMAYGMASPLAMDLAQAVADFATGTGLSADRIPRLALALGQIQAAGHLTGLEMRQLTEAGLGVDTVARAMKMPIEDVAKAITDKKIAAKDLLPALVDIIESDFGGAAARMAFSWAGLGETVGDVARISLRSLLTPAFEALEPLLTRFILAITDPTLQAQLSALGERIGVWVAGAVERLTGLIEWAIENWDWLSDSLRNAAIAFGGMMIILTIIGLVQALLNPLGQAILIIGAVTAVVGILTAAWEEDWGSIRTTLTNVWEKGLKPAFEAIKITFTETIPNALKKVRDQFTEAWNNIRTGTIETFTRVKDAIIKPFQEAWDWLHGLWDGLVDWIRHIFDNVHIPLPHFSVNWGEVLGVRIPTGVSVQWYGTGLDAIFTRPTLIGVGERGAERVQVTPIGAGSGGGNGGGGDTWNITIYPRESEVSSLRDLLTMLQMAGA